MGNLIVKVLMGGLGERVIITLLIVVLDRAQVAAKATATPIDDAIVAGVLDALRQMDAKAVK